MGVFELPIVINNNQKRLNESLQYKKYYIYKHLQTNEDKILTRLGKRTQLRRFKKSLRSFKKLYVHQFDRPQIAYEEWYPTQIIDEGTNSNEEKNNNASDDEVDHFEPLAVNESDERPKIDLSAHKFNSWNHYSTIKDLKKKNKMVLLATTKKQHLEAYDKAFLKKTKIHYKTRNFLTDFSENDIIKNSFKLLNVSNVIQIWHMSVYFKNWERAYKCMSIIVRIENIELKQIYSLIIVTLQNYRSALEVDDSEKDILLNFLKWITFKNSPLVKINLNRTQTDKFPFFNRIKTFETIPNVIYFYFYYNILLYHKKFMETLDKKDIVKFKQFLNSLEEMMLVPPFQNDFIFNYFLGLSYLILVDLNSILLDSNLTTDKESIMRDVNLNLNKSIKIFKELSIPTELDRHQESNTMTVQENKSSIYNNKNDKRFYFNQQFIAEQLDFLKNKIFGKGSDTDVSSSDIEDSEAHKNFEFDDDELMRQESLIFETLNGVSTQLSQQSPGHNQNWLD
ncbi:hypothetical protein QEN19_000411 [Hanseniaspora menglaensis]